MSENFRNFLMAMLLEALVVASIFWIRFLIDKDFSFMSWLKICVLVIVVSILGYKLYDLSRNPQIKYKITSNDTVEVKGINMLWSPKSIVIPDIVEIDEKKYSVTSIAWKAFYKNRNLQEVKLPFSLTSIGDSAFSRCEKLKSVEIPPSVNSIGVYAFYGCTNLKSIYIPSSVNSIGERAFRYCGLEEVKLNFGLKTIGVEAFELCRDLKSIRIPSSVTYIGEKAFRCCLHARVVIDNSAKNVKIAPYAFYGCESLHFTE